MKALLRPTLLTLALTSAFAAWGADAPSTDKLRQFYGSAALGGFMENSNAGHFNNEQGKFAGYVGFGWRYLPNISLEAEVIGYSQEVDTPSGYMPGNGSADNRSSVTVVGIVPQIKYVIPMNTMDFFMGGGFGIYSATGTVTGKINNTDFRANETDAAIGAQVVVGVDFKFAERYSLGIEGRHTWFKANLSNFSNGKVDLGGDQALLAFRMWF
jgi:hypothetical protein